MSETFPPANASPASRGSKPPSYTIDVKLPFVDVSRDFLQDLERYILSKAEEHSRHESIKLREGCGVEIQDSMGENELSSISYFEAATYPNDTKQIKLSYRCACFSLSIRLSLEDARIRSSVCKQGAREARQGIHAGVLRMFKQHTNWNWIYHNPFATGVVGGAFTLACVSLVTPAWCYGLPPALFCVGYLASTRWKPFCVFPTRQNASRQYWYRWFVGAILVFLLFTVVGVYFRKRLLGF
jgi:hypothetical protein